MTMAKDDEKSALQDEAQRVAICGRLLNDMIAHLAARFGVGAVVIALTEMVGCQSCVAEATRGASIRTLVERLKGPPGISRARRGSGSESGGES